MKILLFSDDVEKDYLAIAYCVVQTTELDSQTNGLPGQALFNHGFVQFWWDLVVLLCNTLLVVTGSFSESGRSDVQIYTQTYIYM